MLLRRIGLFIRYQVDRLSSYEMSSKHYGVLVAILAVPVFAACWFVSPIHLSGPSLYRFEAFFCAFVLVSLFPVGVSSERTWLTTMLPIGMACAYLYGAFAAVSLSLAAMFVTVLMMDGRQLLQPSERKRFMWSCIHNIPMSAISTGIPSLLYCLLMKASGVGHHSLFAAVSLSMAAVADFYINALLIATLVALCYKMRWDVVWYNNYRWTLISTVLLSPLGFIMGALSEQSILFGLGFIMIPLIAIYQGYSMHERRMSTYREGIELLGKLMQESHPYTHGHLNRVASWAVKIAESLSLPAQSMSHVQNAAILHDIGKIALDDRILNKVEKLTDEEWQKIKDHPVLGAEIAAKMKYLDTVAMWIRHHHERIDGKGYPDGLTSEDIPIESRIICVVDAFDAMVGGPSKADQRTYRQPKTMEEARAELLRCAGTQFDEKVVSCFIEILEQEDRDMRASHAAEMLAVPRLTLVSKPTTHGATTESDSNVGVRNAA